jgi:hypothetical protein
VVFNAIFNIISVLLVEKTGIPRENHLYMYVHVPVASH